MKIFSAIIYTIVIFLLVFFFIFQPLFVVLFLIIPTKLLFIFLSSLLLLALFILYGILILRTATGKRRPSRRVIFNLTAALLVLSFGSHSIASFIVDQKFKKTVQEARTAGIKLTLEEVVPPPISDEENAALVYRQAFDLADKLKIRYKKEWEYMPYAGTVPVEKLTPPQKSTIGRIIRGSDFAKFYGLIEKAVNLPACRFDIKYGDSFAIHETLSHHSKIRNLARLVSARTYILIEEKRYRDALESVRVGLRLGDSLTDEPLLISQLVRIAADIVTINSSRPLLSAFPNSILSENYRKLILEIDRKDKNLTKAIESEPIIFTGYRMELVYLGGRQRTLKSKNFLKAYRNYVLKPMFKPESAFYMQGIMTLADFSNKPYFSIKSALDAWEKKIAPNPKTLRHILARAAMPALRRAIERQAAYTAYLESFKIALALKIYRQKRGYYPASLSFLSPEVIPELPLDPFTGKDYVYRKKDKGFIVYSVADNLKDDGGISQFSEEGRKGDFDIVWEDEGRVR